LAMASVAHPQNPPASGSRFSRPPSALPQLVLPPLSTLFESNPGEDRRNSSSDAQQDADGRPPEDPSQRKITAHLMHRWEAHKYILGHISLARSEEYLKLQSVQRIPAVPKAESDTIFNQYFPQTAPAASTSQPAPTLPAAPAEKKKVWNLNWSPLSWLADMSAHRPVTRFSLDLWMSFFCRSMGAPIPMLQAHAVARTMCACKKFSLDPHGDHVLTCKKHTGATRGHDHIVEVLAALVRNSGDKTVRVNYKVSQTAADSRKQGDVEIVGFGLAGSSNFVLDVSVCCDHYGNSQANNGLLNGKMRTNDYLQERAQKKIRKYRADYEPLGTAFAPAIVSVAGQIHPEFLRLLWVLADTQTCNYYALIGAEEEVGSEAFKWSRARTFSFNKNSIGKAIAYAAATRLHLSVHSTAPPARRQAGRSMSSAQCLMNGAVHASHRAPPRPAVDVVVGAHGAAPSAAANPAGTSGSAGVPNGVAHAAGGVRRPQRTVVAATTWLAAPVSPGLCAHDGASSDVDLTPRLDAQAAGQDLGSNSAFSCLPASAVQEDADADLDELDHDDGHMDVLSVLRDGAPRFADDDDDADLVVGADVQVGVSGGASGLSGGVSVGVSLGVSLGVGPVAALPPPSHPPPSSLDS